MERASFRTNVLTRHLLNQQNPNLDDDDVLLQSSPCISYTPAEASEPAARFDVFEMRKLMDGHNLQERDWLYGVMIQSKVFNPRSMGGRVHVGADYNQAMEQQREMTMRRIEYLSDCGVFRGWLTENDQAEAELRKVALCEVIAIFDFSLAIKIGVQVFL
ncbi:PREDICTED: acyl-coenzyme A oxidase 3, peroxisomal-like [Ipomoea nil]|uniref:acyl-coenzyme A oxidase 3, peroxisomal-like n=1 Tax=Ipomoea nil TaxID=35883 RepID=UPI00090184EE|nr:PREDICTED: acyl-coenzyme A oxidase 3, peroxisomal-like [Ipomoea nil]